MRSAIRDVGLLGCTYLFVWGVTWSMGSRSAGVFGLLDDGTSYHFYPRVLLGGLPPEPWAGSDAPQALAAIIGGLGFAALILLGVRRGRSAVPPEVR